MIHFDSDWLWLIPIALQATEHLAATSHLAAQQAAIISSQSVIRPPRYVPFMQVISRISQVLYFIPVSISRVVKLTVNVHKTLILKVFGSGQ